MADIYDEDSYEPRKGVSYLMYRVRSEMLGTIGKELARDEELGPLEVSSAQYIILSALGKRGTQSTSTADLCKEVSYDAGAMTRMIDRLEEKGLLRRQRDVDDRRVVKLELTEAGNAALPRMRRISMRVLNRYLRGFTAEEAQQLEGFLHRMLDNIPTD